MTARLLEKYKDQVAPALSQRFGYRNRMAVPRLEKIVVSMGIGTANQDQAEIQRVGRLIARALVQRRAENEWPRDGLIVGKPLGAGRRAGLKHLGIRAG